MDETNIKVKGQWQYVYRAGDASGQTIDKRGANTAALASLNVNKATSEPITVRQQKYLNNLVEQAHSHIKRRIRP